MICPHCRANLLRKQRTGSRCATCKRTFAFDPKTNSLGLHDLRVQALARTLATRGRAGLPDLRYTADQLRHAAARKVLGTRSSGSRWLGCAVPLGIVGFIASAIAGATAGSGGAGAGIVLTAVVVGLLVVGHVRTADRRRYRGMPVGHDQFASMLNLWRTVHGTPPAGLLPPSTTRLVQPTSPARAVLLCPDADTVGFLAAAGLAQRHPLVLVTDLTAATEQWPPRPVVDAAMAGLPVLALHDADARGCLLTAHLRAALPGARVIDAGLRPRVAMRAGPPVRLRPPAGLLDQLRAAGTDLDAVELAWLAEGATVPLAAVLPARLVAAVERAVERALADDDPDRARARAIGFLS